ncbi:MAG: hypothetical protein ACO27F_11055 [Beijerinckiaceae bacterium]|jgi:hypothetical protein
MGSTAFWTGEFTVMAGIIAMTLLFAVVYAALENVFPFLRGGMGRV